MIKHFKFKTLSKLLLAHTSSYSRRRIFKLTTTPENWLGKIDPDKFVDKSYDSIQDDLAENSSIFS